MRRSFLVILFVSMHVVLGGCAQDETLAAPRSPSPPREGNAGNESDNQAAREPSLKALLAPPPALSPKDSLRAMRVEPGFAVELVAAEPDVVDPIALAFDEDGRLYVCEDIDYPFKAKDLDRPLGRVRLLEDKDNDGRFETSHIFAERVHWPSGVVCWRGGVFVAAPPQILYLKDTDGDGRADVRRVVYDGFGTDTAEDILNNLAWGPDNLIYGAASYNGGDVRRAEGESKPVSVRMRSFRFDPDSLEFESVPETGDFGNCFDDWGNRFFSNAGMLLMHQVIPGTYLDRNPHLPPTRVVHRSAASKKLMAQISPPERWRVVRKQYWDRWINTTHDMRAARFSDAELAEKGFVTGGAGCAIYRGAAFPEEFRGDSFTAEPAGNVVIRLKVRPSGVTFDATAVSDEREFLASTDNGFRPVNVANGPDGCLYVLDMSRQIIEDPSAIPQDILEHLDVTAGRDRGRIYRVVPDDFKRPSPPRLSKADTTALVESLSHANAWHRETAQRLLVERNDRAAAPLLKATGRDAALPQAKLHTMWTLHRLNELDEDTLLKASRDEHAAVREHAARLAESHFDDSPALLDRVAALAGDESRRVRMQAALSLGAAKDRKAALPALASIIRRDGDDPWMRLAVLTAVPNDPGALAAALMSKEQTQENATGRATIGPLLDLVGARGDANEATRVLKAIIERDAAKDTALRLRWLSQLSQGLSRSRLPLRSVIERLREEDATTADAVGRLLGAAGEAALDGKASPTDRLAAVRLAGQAEFDAFAKVAADLLSVRHSTQLQLAVVQSLAAYDDPRAGALLLARWPHMSPAVRSEATEVLFRRPAHLPLLLDAIEKKTLAATELAPARIDALRSHEDATIRDRAARLLTATGRESREDAIRRFEPALKLTGDATGGKAVFQERCATCHRVSGVGHDVGAELAGVAKISPEELLTQIIDPNRKVEPRYLSYIVKLEDGQILTGIIATESAAGVTLRRPSAVEETVPRDQIESLRSSGLSLMPENLEAGLTPQQMADLLAFLRLAEAKRP